MTQMKRKVAWFSCGAASAIATKQSNPDVIAYCETGSEDYDNKRFMGDCESWFEKKITLLKSVEFNSTWEVWNKRKYLSGISGAPCTGELKVKPRLDFQKPRDIHVLEKNKRCGIGGFAVQKTAVCDEWEAKKW